MSDAAKRPSVHRTELRRWLTGSLVEWVIKAYGAGAALSVALSDAETVAGKRDDALAAVPNLAERYREAEYVAEHREEISAAADYVNENAPDPEEVEGAAEQSAATLDEIERTYSEVVAAKDAFSGYNPFDWQVKEGAGHVQEAWEARPDLGSIGELAEVADQVSPFVREVEVLLPAFYGGVLTVMDNFAGDEIADTLLVMAVALALAWTFGTLVAFWKRRGRPGLVARTLQRWGARRYRDWYVDNPDYALGRSVYAAARERAHRELVADPQTALDPESHRALEEHFERRRADTRTG